MHRVWLLVVAGSTAGCFEPTATPAPGAEPTDTGGTASADGSAGSEGGDTAATGVATDDGSPPLPPDAGATTGSGTGSAVCQDDTCDPGSICAESECVPGAVLPACTPARTRGWTRFDLPVAQATEVRGLAAQDLDADGAPDLALLTASQILSFTNRGDASFVAGESAPLMHAQASALASGDFDADGLRDLVVTHQITPGAIVTIPNLGNGTFGPPTERWSLHLLEAARTADVNADGIDDVVFSGHGQLQVLQGDGRGDFYENYPVVDATLHHRFTLGDTNEDDLPDVVGLTRQGLQVLRADQAFELPVGVASLDVSVEGGVALDVDQDLIPDLVGVGSAGEDVGVVEVWPGNGVGSWTAPILRRTALSHLRDPAVADVDGDGIRDLIALGPDVLAVIYVGYVGGLDCLATWDRPPGVAAGMVVEDLDGDDHPDVAIALESPPGGGVLSVFHGGP